MNPHKLHTKIFSVPNHKYDVNINLHNISTLKLEAKESLMQISKG